MACANGKGSHERGFSLLEVLIAMAIGSILLLSASRFLPALHMAMLRQTRQQALEDEVWQRLYTVGKHLQRAGFCRGECSGQPLVIAAQGACVIVQWDGNSNGRWDVSPPKESDQTGFRLRNAALETLRGADSCDSKGWEKMTDPQMLHVEGFQVQQTATAGFAPELTVTLSASIVGHADESLSATYSVTGFNL
nr:prepilin peptidase-dependent protein [uncultured Enterobacter sp.]